MYTYISMATAAVTTPTLKSKFNRSRSTPRSNPICKINKSETEEFQLTLFDDQNDDLGESSVEQEYTFKHDEEDKVYHKVFKRKREILCTPFHYYFGFGLLGFFLFWTIIFVIMYYRKI